MKMVHVTIQTAEFDEEVRFYREHVGLKIIRDMRSAGRNMVFLANNEGETNIEIIENKDAADSGSPDISIGFRIEDIEKKREEMSVCGYEPTPVVSPSPEVNFFFVKDPAGVNVQFIV